MSSDTYPVEIGFDVMDAVERTEAHDLLADLAAVGVNSEIIAEHPPGKGMFEAVELVALIGVSTVSAGSLAAITAFLYRVFHKGVILDLRSSRPRVRKSDDLPKGTVLILNADGTADLHEGLASSAVGDLMNRALSPPTRS